MRYFIAAGLVLVNSVALAAADYQEVRELSISGDRIGTLAVDSGAGSLDVRGVEGQERIEVRATIVVKNADDDEGRAFIGKRIELVLDRDGDTARLVSRVDQPKLGWGSSARIDIEITAPPALALRIDDGSGSIDIAGFISDVRVDDGSGSIDVRSVGSLTIDDGSGSIDVSGVSGDVYVNDGSGSLTIEGVGGSVTIDDGSGSIRVNDVGQDLIIIDAGSGSVSFSGIQGTVEQDS